MAFTFAFMAIKKRSSHAYEYALPFSPASLVCILMELKLFFVVAVVPLDALEILLALFFFCFSVCWHCC